MHFIDLSRITGYVRAAETCCIISTTSVDLSSRLAPGREAWGLVLTRKVASCNDSCSRDVEGRAFDIHSYWKKKLFAFPVRVGKDSH